MERAEEEEEEEEGEGKVRGLIERATNSTAGEVDPRLLKAIKSVVRYSDSELRTAAHALMDLMKRDHSQVRYLSLLVIDELFMRSKLFRTILVENFDQLLSLSVGFRRNLPLPAPPTIASRLRSKAIEFLEKWNDSFGVHYRQIRLGFEYLKNTLRFQFPGIQENAARLRQAREEREMRSREILKNKFEALKENFSLIKQEIQSTIDEIVECLRIVNSKEESVALGPLDEEDFEEFRPAELRQIRLDALREAEKVHESYENKVVFDTLRELYKLLETKHLISVREWITVIVKVETTDSRLRDLMLKEFIDIRNHIQLVKKQCIESGVALSNTKSKDKEEEEEDFWEEGHTEPAETRSLETGNKLNDNSIMASSSRVLNGKDPEHTGEKPTHNDKSMVASSSRILKGKASERTNEKSTRNGISGEEHGGSGSESDTTRNKLFSDAPVVNWGNGISGEEHGGSGSESDTTRNKLFSDAPVVNWGSFLGNWGSKGDVLLNQRGFELDNHWGRVDYDAVIPAEKIAELNVRVTLYQEEQKEIQPCRAPLRNGGLCQRRDLKVCPFHGPVVPRDDKGNLLDQSASTNDTSSGSGTDLVEKLAKQALKNVRERDVEEARKRKMDKASQKRAKLAKIREHNEAVLKDAALASTSSSAHIGEDGEATGGRTKARNKKETLASMLRKKVTTKDRLAQKLLSSRTSNATRRQAHIG